MGLFFNGNLKITNSRHVLARSKAFSLISESITENRFSKIISMIHFNDNSIIDGNETNFIFKIQPLVEGLKHNFCSTVLAETCMAIDEQMIPFKGRSGLQRYLQKKPKIWGYKLWALTGVSGFFSNLKLIGHQKVKERPKTRTLLPYAVRAILL